MNPHYYVYRVGDRGPKVRHATAALAAAEAERLAAQHPGDTFEVLQCLAVTRTSVPSTFWLDGCGPEETIAAEPWSFDWSAAQGDHTHAAMDEDGCWWSYYQKPKAHQRDFVWDDGSIDCQPFDHPPFPGDWKDSLQIRPAKTSPPPPEPGYIEITDPEEIIREGDEVRGYGTRWYPCEISIGEQVKDNPPCKFRRPDPTRRVVPIPKEYLPPPPLPEGKTQWVGRGTFEGKVHRTPDRQFMFYIKPSGCWDYTTLLSGDHFHIEAI